MTLKTNMQYLVKKLQKDGLGRHSSSYRSWKHRVVFNFPRFASLIFTSFSFFSSQLTPCAVRTFASKASISKSYVGKRTFVLKDLVFLKFS